MPVDTAVQRLQRRRTRILATVGPASDSAEVLSSLVKAGVDVFRLNFSHGEHEDHERSYQRIRRVAEEQGVPVAVLADLSGPKVRVGRFAGGSVELDPDGEVVVTTRSVAGEPGLIPASYGGLADDVSPGDPVLLDDGKLELEVVSVEGTDVRCRVVRGGTLRDRKGMNLPGAPLSIPALTEKDREDARFALGLGVDALALSFVRRADDVRDLRTLVDEEGCETWIVAKIEKPQALDDIDEILDASEAIMVARGDLGVELPPEVVPIAQSQLVDLALSRACPVIVATQMLESMVESGRPTRAEVSDVSGAVRSGADAVMLSGETAVGRSPVAAVRMMDRIARETEGYLWQTGAFGGLTGRSGSSGPDPAPPSGGAPSSPVLEAVSRATSQLSRDLMVRAIIVFTRRGWTACQVSAGRPQAPVLAATPNVETWRRLSLLWGVVPVLVDRADFEAGPETARRLARESGLAEAGHHALQVRGFHHERKRNQPSLTVLTV